MIRDPRLAQQPGGVADSTGPPCRGHRTRTKALRSARRARPRPPRHAQSHEQPGRCVSGRRQARPALPLLDKLWRCGSELGPDHPDTLDSMNNLAGGCTGPAGRFAQAVPLIDQALENAEGEARGPDHPDTLTAMNNLAVLYRTQGQFDQGPAAPQQALEICRRVLGRPPRHAHLHEQPGVVLRQASSPGRAALPRDLEAAAASWGRSTPTRSQPEQPGVLYRTGPVRQGRAALLKALEVAASGRSTPTRSTP